MLGGMTLVFTRTACPATRHKYVYHGKNEMQPLFVKKHSYYPALASNPTHGGGGMVDRYMDWHDGYRIWIIHLCYGVVLYTICDKRIVVARQCV